MNYLSKYCLPPTKIILYTSYVTSNGSPQHIEITYDTTANSVLLTLLNLKPGDCPLLRRELIGRNHCRLDKCTPCNSNPHPTEPLVDTVKSEKSTSRVTDAIPLLDSATTTTITHADGNLWFSPAGTKMQREQPCRHVGMQCL